MFSLYICRLKGQEVSIKGVFKHRTPTTPLAEQYPRPEVAPLLFPHSVPRQTGTNRGGEGENA